MLKSSLMQTASAVYILLFAGVVIKVSLEFILICQKTHGISNNGDIFIFKMVFFTRNCLSVWPSFRYFFLSQDKKQADGYSGTNGQLAFLVSRDIDSTVLSVWRGWNVTFISLPVSLSCKPEY